MSEEFQDAELLVPEACTLPTVEQPLRLTEIEELFSIAVRSVERRDHLRLRLGLEPGAAVAARTADLMVRESACCSFFTFTLISTEGELALEVAVPPGYVDVLDALADRAAGVSP